MPYTIIDRKTWDSLIAARWYHNDKIRKLCLHLMKVDYSNVDDRLKAHSLLNKTFEMESNSIFHHDLRFPKHGSFFNGSNLKFRDVYYDLAKLLLRRYGSPSVEDEVESTYLFNSEEYRDKVIRLNEITASGLWTRCMFESSIALWGNRCNGSPSSYDVHVFKSYQVTDLITSLHTILRKTEEKNATIELLNTTIVLKDATIKEKYHIQTMFNFIKNTVVNTVISLLENYNYLRQLRQIRINNLKDCQVQIQALENNLQVIDAVLEKAVVDLAEHNDLIQSLKEAKVWAPAAFHYRLHANHDEKSSKHLYLVQMKKDTIDNIDRRVASAKCHIGHIKSIDISLGKMLDMIKSELDERKLLEEKKVEPPPPPPKFALSSLPKYLFRSKINLVRFSGRHSSEK
ncbi:hypothetical protein BDB01DRAFT_838540 [Pilobolus umbonatus]|nr:hypothetical protein BDB01DRAFT_838540 [Pilobolus umbonatus]